MLFNLRGEKIVRTADDRIGGQCGFIREGKALWNLRYADNTKLIIKSKEQLEEIFYLLVLSRGEQTGSTGHELYSSMSNISYK